MELKYEGERETDRPKDRDREKHSVEERKKNESVGRETDR